MPQARKQVLSFRVAAGSVCAGMSVVWQIEILTQGLDMDQ